MDSLLEQIREADEAYAATAVSLQELGRRRNKLVLDAHASGLDESDIARACGRSVDEQRRWIETVRDS